MSTSVVKRRFIRQIILPEIGEQGQQNLAEAGVLVVGAGGLGCPVLQYLAAAGVGRLGIVDFDRVETENLHRQVLFGDNDVGMMKTGVAAEKVKQLNASIRVDVIPEQLSSQNALDIFEGYDIVIDCTDNFPARYLINDAAVLSGIPDIYGSIYRFEGQISVFNLPQKDGSSGVNYRDLFPTPPPPGMVPNCADAGVIGALPGIVGTMQASEAIKIITGAGEPLSGRLFVLDTLSFQASVISIKKRADYEISELIDYNQFCGTGGEHITEITYSECKEWLKNGDDIQLVDVRNKEEHDRENIGGTLMPLPDIDKQIQYLNHNKKIVLYCETGKRSRMAANKLIREYQFSDVYNLKGGIKAI